MLKGHAHNEIQTTRPGDTLPIFYGSKKLLKRISPIRLLENLGITNRLEVLENIGYKITYFEIIDLSGSPSGSITFPANSSLIIDGFEGNAVLSRLNANGAPNGDRVDAPSLSSVPITVSLDAAGNYTASSTTTEPVAILYQIAIDGKDRDNLNQSQVIDYFEENFSVKVLGLDNRAGYLAEKIWSADNTVSFNVTTTAGLTRLSLEANIVVKNGFDPVATDDSYPLGHFWINTVSGELFYLTDNTPSAAVWVSLTAGAGDKNYVHTQGVAAAVWNINHGLNKKPSVTVVDSGGTEVEGDILHIDNNNVTITFSAAFSGEAYFN
jgi:hypothetical protein